MARMRDGVIYPEVRRAAPGAMATVSTLSPAGTGGGRQRLTITGLVPGRRYAVTGALTDMLVADADGQARFDIDLSGRTAAALAPA